MAPNAGNIAGGNYATDFSLLQQSQATSTAAAIVTGASPQGNIVPTTTRHRIRRGSAAAFASGSPLTTAAVLVVVAVAVVAALIVWTPKAPASYNDVLPHLNVAFVGNSIMFTYDLPRLVETLANGTIAQNSCLHGSLNLASQLRKGNGMYYKFNTDAARIDLSTNNNDGGNGDNYNNNDNDDNYSDLMDFGACSVLQLLFGYDELLDEKYYVDDGMNPCYEDEQYAEYLNELYYEQQQSSEDGKPHWDVVVLNDRTVYPALPQKRKLMLGVLESQYIDMLSATGAKPVLLMTYAYNHTSLYDGSSKSKKNNNQNYNNIQNNNNKLKNWSPQLGSIPEYTSHVWYGYQQYAELLKESLPSSQEPKIAPVGLAFLTVWEEDPQGMWPRLIYQYDQLHPTPHGSYLMGLVLFATIYGRLPHLSVAIPQNDGQDVYISSLWSNARKLQVISNGPSSPFPTREEAKYLYRIAERVALGGYIPKTLLSLEETQRLEDEFVAEDNGDDDGGGDADDDDDFYAFEDDDDNVDNGNDDGEWSN